jgi:hypothetical protein
VAAPTDPEGMTDRLDHAAFVGAGIAALGGLAALADVATRPPCPDNYVRLIDVVPIAGVVCGALALVLAWRAGWTTPMVSSRKDVRGVTVVVSMVLTAVAALPMLIAVGSLLQHRGQSIDSNCWTF